MQEYVAFWKNYANFSDCTSRRGYWMVILFNAIISTVLYLLNNVGTFFAIISVLYSLATLIPSLALLVRRLRDAGKYWTWIFITLVPFVGSIVLFVFLCQPTSNYTGIQV